MSSNDNTIDKGIYAGHATSEFQDAAPENVDKSSAVTSGTLPETGNLVDKDGGIGKQFKSDGAVGSIGQSVGGIFSKDGAIGKHFTESGSVGGTVQKNMGEGESTTDMVKEKLAGGENVFDKKGEIGSEFTTRGSIGEKAQEVGGVFSKDGIIGKQFTTGGSVGGTVQDKAGDKSLTEKISDMLQPGDSKFDKAANVPKQGITDGAIGRSVNIGNAFHPEGAAGEKSVSGTASEKLAEARDKFKDTTGTDPDAGTFQQKEGIFEKSVFDKSGAVGKEFEPSGAVGSTAQSLGGSFDKEGAIGKQFTTDGSMGGTAQTALGDRGFKG